MTANSILPGAQDNLARAIALHGDGELSKAEALYNSILSLDPDHAGSLCYLGLLRSQEGKAEEGAALLRRSTALDPGSAEAHAYLAAALQQLGAAAEAEASLVKALSLQPEHAGALCQLGTMRLQQGNAQDAAGLFRRAVVQSPESPEPLTYLGVALHHLRAYEEALACQEKALMLAPDSTEAILHSGRTLQALGRGAEAIVRYEAGLARTPNNPQLQIVLASALEASGRDQEAFVRYRNAAGLDPNLTAPLTKSLANYAQRRPAVAQAGMQRLNAYVSGFLTNQSNARMGVYPGLSSAPFHDSGRLPGALALELNYEAIRAEVEGLAATEFQEEAENLKGRGAWDVLFFYERGRKNEQNLARCPVIANLIDSHNTVRTSAGLIYVSKFSPDTQVKPHRGPTNMRLRCHVGIKIPGGDCGLKVGGETRRWQEGKCLVFDDSFEHEAWNLSSEPRVVLIVDFWHPDLTPGEIAYLEGLHRYASFQADSLNRYWSANAEARSKARKHYD